MFAPRFLRLRAAVVFCCLSVAATLALSASERIVDWRSDGKSGASIAAWQIEQWAPVREAALRTAGPSAPAGAVLNAKIVGLTDGAGSPPAQLIYPVGLQANHRYHVEVDIAATDEVQVEVMLRGKPAPYESMGFKTVTLTRDWQRVEFDAAWPAPAVAGDVRIASARNDSEVFVRRLTVDDLGPLPLGSMPVQPFSAMLLGAHVNKLGAHTTWPAFDPGLIRLWDTGTNWHHLAPTAEAFDTFSGSAWQRLDMYVDYVRKNSDAAAVLYTLGEPPRWASDNPDAKCSYGTGTCGGPKSMATWRHYIRTLAQRYKGRITYWELWNEADYEGFYQSPQSLVELAKAAREELQAVDKSNRLLSPGFTQFGIRNLEQFLRAGGARYVDAIAFHWYYSGEPEHLAARIFNVRLIMARYGAGDKPLWNTEGSPLCQGRQEGKCVLDGLTAEEQDAVTARAILTMWVNGVSAYAYYFVEGMEGQTLSLLTPDLRDSSRAGQILAQFRGWMIKAEITSIDDFDGRGHVLTIRNGAKKSYLLWSEIDGVAFAVPAKWSVERYEKLGERATAMSSQRRLSVGRIPVLLSAVRPQGQAYYSFA